MTVVALAALLPALFWDAGPQTAPALREAGIDAVFVPASGAKSWTAVSGITVDTADPQQRVKLITPSVNYRMYDASATQAPWINSNGWRYLRNAGKQFFVDAPGASAALAAAEAFMFGGQTLVRTDAAGLKPLGRMLGFLRTLHDDSLPALVNIGFVDDGSPASGERMNMMMVRNLLFNRLAAPDPQLDLNVSVGSKDYPDAAWRNPDLLAHVIRSKLTDEKRLVRIYGSEVVLARLTGAEGRLRLQLLNYAGGQRGVQGVRVRVLGQYPHHTATACDIPGTQLMDYIVAPDATEFTVPELKTYAVIDLSR